jgi:hypothetical protein
MFVLTYGKSLGPDTHPVAHSSPCIGRGPDRPRARSDAWWPIESVQAVPRRTVGPSSAHRAVVGYKSHRLARQLRVHHRMVIGAVALKSGAQGDTVRESPSAPLHERASPPPERIVRSVLGRRVLCRKVAVGPVRRGPTACRLDASDRACAGWCSSKSLGAPSDRLPHASRTPHPIASNARRSIRANPDAVVRRSESAAHRGPIFRPKTRQSSGPAGVKTPSTCLLVRKRPLGLPPRTDQQHRRIAPSQPKHPASVLTAAS